jgi:hypothetical protein
MKGTIPLTLTTTINGGNTMMIKFLKFHKIKLYKQQIKDITLSTKDRLTRPSLAKKSRAFLAKDSSQCSTKRL